MNRNCSRSSVQAARQSDPIQSHPIHPSVCPSLPPFIHPSSQPLLLLLLYLGVFPVFQMGPGKQMPVVGPNQILDMPLFAKIPFLPGSNTMFYTTNLGEKLYQPSATFDLSDPYCKVMAPRYKSLHDPHLRAYYKRKDNLRRLKKAGQITDKNKVVCSLKEFNEYRQYLTSLKLEFEKHYMREQKMLEKQVTKLQEANLLPEGADTSKYRDWMLKEERPTILEQEAVMRNRYLELINQELEKLEQLAEENRHLALAQDDAKKQGSEKRRQLLLRKKMEEEWRKKEMMLLMKIGDDVKREAKIEEQRRKSKEEKLKRKQNMLEKKMAHHLKKLQEQFQREGFLPPGRLFPGAAPEDHGPPAKRLASMGKKSKDDTGKATRPDQKLEGLPEEKGPGLPEGGSPAGQTSQTSLSKAQSSTKPSLVMLPPESEAVPCKSASSHEQETVLDEQESSKKEHLVDSEAAGESLLPPGFGSQVSLSRAKEGGSVASLAGGSLNTQSADLGPGAAESTDDQVAPSASGAALSTGGAASACGSAAGGGSKTSCCGSAGCGSKTSCCGSAGCGSTKSCCGSAGCGSKKSCCGSAGCGSSKKSCCGSGGCGSTKCCGSAGCGSTKSCCGSGGCGSTKCCGSAGCGSSKSCCGSAGCGSTKLCCGSAGCGSTKSCCGSGGCCSNKCCGSAGCGTSNGKGTGGSDSSGSSSKHRADGRNSKRLFSSSNGAHQPNRTPPKASTKMTMSSAVSQHTVSEGPGKVKHKKRATLMFSQCEPETLLKERSSSKKRRVDKHKAEHRASTSQENDSESSYSAYLQRLLSNSDNSALRESLKGKVSTSELNSIIQNIMTWVVSAVTSILYPALTKFEERVRTRVYTISEESILSSDNSSSCSTCNEDFCSAYGSLPCTSARKVSFTDTTIKPTASSAREFHAARGKPTSLLSSKSSFTSFTKSTHISLDSDLFVGKFKRGKAAILWTPSKHSGLLSTTTTTSMRSSKSDTHLAEMQKGAAEAPEKPIAASYHSKHKSTWPRGLFSKTDAATTTTATTSTTDLDQVPFSGGEHKPPHDSSDQRQSINLKDVESIFADLKSPLTQITATVLDDIFKQILGDLGCSACSVSLSVEILLESISENLLGSSPPGSPATGSVSRIASFVANDLVESVLGKLQSVAQKTYVETISKDDFAAKCKDLCVVAAGSHTLPDLAFWKDRMPLSLEFMCGIAEEIVQLILDKLKAFALSSQTKVSQFELFAKIKAIGIPLEQIYTAASPHTVESEAAAAIVKDTVRKIVSKTVASSETNILQYVEEMVASILSYLQRWLSQEGTPLARESSILLQLINDVFNSLSTEKLQGIYPAAKGRASSKTPGEHHSPETLAAPETRETTVTTTTLFTAEMMMRKPFPPVNVPGMVVYPEAEVEEEEGGRHSSVAKERKVLVTEEEEEKVRCKSVGLESRQRSRPHPEDEFPDPDGKSEPNHLEKMESCLENFVQEAIFCSLEGQQTVDLSSGAKGATGPLEQALKKMEEDLKEGEGSPIISLLRNVLNEMFQRVWAEQPLWPATATTPSSLVHVGLSRQHLEDQPPSKGPRPEFSGCPPVSEADIRGLASDLVKTAFQKISQATQTDPQDLRSRHSTVVITDILPLKEPTEAGRGLPTVHFKDPEMTFESGGTQTTTPQEDPTKAGQPEQNPPSKPDLARDLVEIFITKLECFVTSKVESQLGLDVQSLKTSAGSDVCSAIQQELQRILASRHGSLPSCLEEIFNSYSNSLLAEKEKPEHALPLSYANLKSYAEDVARTMLKSLKHNLDKEVEKIPTPPVIFSESIVASHIVSMVFTIVAPREHDNEEAPSHFLWGESVLEKLLRKNATYKRNLQIQIQNTVETFLNEIYHTIMLGLGGSSSPLSGPEKFQNLSGERSQIPKAGDDQALPTTAMVKSDVSVVSSDLVDIILEDLRFGLAAALHKKGPLSARLQSLLFELIQKSFEPFAPLTDQRAKVGSQGEAGPQQLPELRDFSPEGIAKYLVDNISLRLETFAEEKLESQLSLNTHLEESRVPGRSCREKAKLAVQDSLSNLRLCAEKLTSTILKIIQKDLEREMLSCQNLLPYEDSASANEMVNDLLKVLSVQVALTENEVHKRVLKRIFRRRQPRERGASPLLAGVEDVLNQVTQRIMGNLGHWPGFQNDSLFIGPDSKSSAYQGVAETVSQMSAGGVAGEIVDGVLNKMYNVVADTLFSSSESGSGADSLSSDKALCSTEAPRLSGKPDLRKMTLALSQLQPPPQSLGEELVQTVLNRIALFAASNLEEVLPSSVRQKRKRHATFRCDMQAGDGLPGQPQSFSDDSESSLMRVNLSKSDLTVYAKDVVGKVLGTLMDEFKAEDYHRTTLRVNTLSSEQISRASNLVHSVVQDLRVTQHDRMDGLPSTQISFQFESTVKAPQGKPKGFFYEDFAAYLKQVLPKEGILKEIFEQQPWTDANINESLKMLQVAENIVSEVFMRIRDLEPSVCILKKIPGELSERLFCDHFKRAEAPGLFHSDSQTEIGSIARDIVASVFENVHKCLACSVPAGPEKDTFLRRKDRTALRGSGRVHKHRFTQPEFPFYNVSLKGAMDTIDKIAKETVECVLVMLETFVARHFRRDFKCNFFEIVKFPLESLSFAQLTRSLDSLSTQVGNVAETTMEAFRNKLQGSIGKGTLPTLGSAHNFLDFSKLGGAITRECVEMALRQVQMLQAELGVYANNAVSGILEIIKRTLDRELVQKEATLFSSSSESLVLSETVSVMLDRCNESLTEITSELMVENLQLEMSGRAFARDKTLVQDLAVSPVKTTSKKYRRIDVRDTFPPINVPGMVVYSEEEAEVQEEVPSKFPSVYKSSEWDVHFPPDRYKYTSFSAVTPWSRPPGRRRQNRGSNQHRLDFLEDEWLPRESSIPEGSVLEKLFKKAAESEATPGLSKAGPQSKGGLAHHRPRQEKRAEPLGRGPALRIPDSTCYSAICPLKLGQTAETIVSTLLGELGLENESQKVRPLSHRKEKSPRLGASGSSVLADAKQKRASLLNHWEKRQGDYSSEETNGMMMESCLVTREGSSLLSKWESKQFVFRPKSPERHKDLALLACSHIPDPCEIHLLANHIVLSVIKELISFRPKDASDETASWPAWKQELLQSESRWLQERIWRSSYFATARKPSSCLEVLWEPLTLTVVSNVLLTISNPSIRYNARERNELFENHLSVFCSVDASCPEDGPDRGPKSSFVNIKELAFQISEVIVGTLCERRVLHEGVSKQGSSRTKRSKYIYIPPLCLADFDDVYHLLVKEVGRLLCLETEWRGKFGDSGRAGDRLLQRHDSVSPVCFSRASRGDCRGPEDLSGAACLSTMHQLAWKNPRLSSVASNLDSFIRSLKSGESKRLVNKVLCIILDSLWPDQSQGGFSGSFWDTQNKMPYQEAGLPSKKNNLSSSVCPHASKLSHNMLSGNLGLSPKSVVLLDVVSEKLIRSLLDKCLMTDHFTGPFAFDEFPEEEQLYDVRKGTGAEEPFPCPGRELEAHRVDSSTSVFSYNIKYTEEPWVETQSRPPSYESALDLLAHTLVKPVMTELSLSLDPPAYMKPFSKKAVGFTQPSSRRARGHTFPKKHGRHAKSGAYSSLPRGRKLEPKGAFPGRGPIRRGAHERNRSILDTAVQHRAFDSRRMAPTGPPAARKPFPSTCTKQTYRREVVTVTGHGDHGRRQGDFSVIYSSLFLEEVTSQLLIKIFSSLQGKYSSDSCINLREMNTLFVNALVEEFKRAGVGVLPRAEEKWFFPSVDSQTVDRIVDSIVREFGFQLAADRDIGRDVETLAGRASEIILMEILDYQLPPLLCTRLPQSFYKNLKAEQIIRRIEPCIYFPKTPKPKRHSPPTYITILSQKYLERVINRLVAQLFPPSEGTPPKEEKRGLSEADFDELCTHMIQQVMKSISKHKIWVAKKDDQCRLHSEKEIQGMVDSVYRNMLEKSGSPLSVQKEVTCRNSGLIDSLTSFIIQEITQHHLQTFFSKEQHAVGTPGPEALSENIVQTVLGSIMEPSVSRAELFPTKSLEDIVSRVLSKIFGISADQKDPGKGQREFELAKVAKRLASSINLQFGRAAVTGNRKGDEHSLGAPLTDVMDDVVDSVCDVMSKERGVAPEDGLSSARENTIFENIKLLVGKQITDNLLHPLFSGGVSKGSASAPHPEDVPGKVDEDAFLETQEENESSSPFSTFLSSGFLKDFLMGLLSKIFPSTPPREAAIPWEERLLLSEAEIDTLSSQLLDDVRRKLLKHEIRVAQEGEPEQYEYSEDEVQRMTDSLCGKIIQKSGSLEAAQREVENKSRGLIDRIASFLIAEVLQKHFQPFVSGEEPLPPMDRAASGDSAMGGLEIYRTAIKPLDLRQATQEEKRGSPASSFLKEIASQLLSKLSSALSDMSLSASGDHLGEAAVRLAQSLTKELEKAQLHVREGPEVPLGSPPPETSRRSPSKKAERGWLPEGSANDEREMSPQQMVAFSFEEAPDQLLQSACPPSVAEAMSLIKERLSVDLEDPEMKPPEIYTTVLSYPVLEAIVDRLLSRIFPSFSSSSPGSGQGEGPFEPELRNKVAQIKKDIMEEVLKQAIWTSTYGSQEEVGISEEAVENMVESVYCDVLHEVLLRQPFPEDRDNLSNLYVTQIACFIINEMFKYHLQSWAPQRQLPRTGDLPETRLTVFPCSLLEKMLHQLLEKIFPTPDSIAACLGKQVDFSEEDFLEMAVNLKNYIIAEISAHEIKLENVSERIPNMDQETEEDIAHSVYNQILQKYPSSNELQDTLSDPRNSAVPEAASLIIREILNFHLHPFLSGSDASNSECLQWQAARHPFSRRIYSALFLEDIVVAFFCKILSSPNILPYAKDSHLSEGGMRDLVVKLVHALVMEFKMLEVKVVHPAGEESSFPQAPVDDVIQTSSAIYEKLLQQCGSELEVFKAFQNNSSMLAEKLALLMIREISGYQLMPLFTGDTSTYLFSFLEAETIVDRVETILPEPPSSGSMFGEMFGKILHRIFPSWTSGGSTDSHDPTTGTAVKRGLPRMLMKEEEGAPTGKSFQSFVGNLYKTVCERSWSPDRKHGSTTTEDHPPLKLPSPPRQSDLSSTLTAKTTGWTIHHVKLGGGEPQLTQIEDSGGIYSSTFLQDVFSGLISKLLSSTPSVSGHEKKEAEAEPPVKTLVESLLKEFAKSPVKVLQVPDGGPPPLGVEKMEVAKIIHASLCGILQDQGSGALIGTDQESQRLLVERLTSALKKEILGYRIQEMPAKTSQVPLCKPFEFGEMAQKVLREMKKTSPSPLVSRPGPLLVSHRFIHEVLAFLLSKILPLPTAASTSADIEDQCAEFDFVHMKLLSKVMSELSKDQNTEVQYLDRVQPNRVVSQTVANSIYNHLLPEFGSPSAVEKCIKAGCTILLERIAEFVLQEVSGNKMQEYFLEEQNRQREAMEAERELEERYEEDPKPVKAKTQLRSHLKGLSIIILEEVAARLLSKIFCTFPMDNVDERDLDSVREVARRIINSLQGLISKNKLKVRQPDDMEDLDSEDSQTVGEVVDSVYTDILQHSSSETSLYEDLTNENQDFANRVACFMVSEISKRDFQSGSESEEESPSPSRAIKLESDKIIQKFLGDMEAEKAKKKSSGVQTPVVPVVFLEEILSRFLTSVFLAQYDLGIHEKSLSKTDVNEIVGLLKTSVEKEMSKNKIGLVASEDQPTLDPQLEEKVNQVVHSVISNVMEKSGSQQELYNDMTTNQVIFPEQVASIIINEISSCNMTNPVNENTQNETLSALELDRIVSKVIARVSCHMEPDEDNSLLELTGLSSMQAESIPEPDNLLESDDLPVKIVPHLGDKPLKIDPNLVSDHLAVLSIKTEPLNKLERMCISKTGMSLMELRRVSASGKSVCANVAVADANKKKERRPSLDMAGRLGVKPREAVCRNSFQSLVKPDIRRVELLKDVESKQDLILRLVVHDINEDQHRRSPSMEDSETDEEEQVLTEHRSFYFPPTAPPTDSTASVYSPSEYSRGSSLTQKKSMAPGRGFPSITISGASSDRSDRKESSISSTLPHISITTQSFVSQIPEVDEEVSVSSTPHPDPIKSPPVKASDASIQTEALDSNSQRNETSMEKVVVGMHLSRDTEETSGHLEITSVYQDKKIQDSVSEQPSEVEDGKVIKVTSSDAVVPERRRSSVLRRVSNTWSKVFSRTSIMGEDKSAHGDRP
ncbi:fibrous sheath-interacting protein 2 isoform X1 [Pogona vitticeps]